MRFKKFTEPVVFVVLFFILNYLVANVFTNTIMSFSQYNRQDKEFFSSHDDLHYLIMGDSHSEAGLNPEIIGSSYNYSSPAENYIHTYYKLKYILNNSSRKIDTVILPIDLHSLSSYKTDRVIIMNQHYLDSYYWLKYIDCIEVGFYKGKLLHYMVDYFIARFFNYAGKMNNVFEYFFNEQKVVPLIKGFTTFEGDYNHAKEKDPTRAKRQAAFHLKNCDYFDRDLVFYFKNTIELCHRNGIKVILVKYPVTRDYYVHASRFIPIERLSQKVDALITKYPGIPILDYHSVFFNHNELFLNSDHLNYQGGCKLSRIIKKRLAEMDRDKTAFPGSLINSSSEED